MTDELKACPFCGKEMSTHNFFSCDGYPQACGCWETTTNGIDAVKVWNTRPLEDALHKQLAERDAMIVNMVEIGNRIVKIAEPEHRAWEKEQLERWGTLVAEWKETK